MGQISLLGCGWLGLPLAKALIAQGFAVKGSTTSPDKIFLLQQAGILPYLISINKAGADGDMPGFLTGSDVLIVDIPPKLRGENAVSFTDKIAALIPYIKTYGISKLIFISSTAVYGDDNTTVTEDTAAKPDTESGKQMLDAEKMLQNNHSFEATVVRFGGLIGENRHPIHHLAGKDNLENPHSPVNIIHLQDCIGIILKIIEKEAWGKTFNAVAPLNATRQEYYTQQAKAHGLPLPGFRYDKESFGKKVMSSTIPDLLGYNFQKL